MSTYLIIRLIVRPVYRIREFVFDQLRFEWLGSDAVVSIKGFSRSFRGYYHAKSSIMSADPPVVMMVDVFLFGGLDLPRSWP